MRANRALPLVALALLASCEKDESKSETAVNAANGSDSDSEAASSPETPFEAIAAAWEAAELEVELSSVEQDNPPESKTCQLGAVSGVYVLLCEFSDAAAAQKAEERELARVGEKTGFSIARGPMLLIAADENTVDPSGKTLNAIGQTFRGLDLPKTAQAAQGASDNKAPPSSLHQALGR